MATIKYKHNQEWRNLEIPLIIQSATGNGGDDTGAPSNLESVVITGTNNEAAFPDLSAYVSDLSQIELMTWICEEKVGTSIDIDIYTYAPKYNDCLFYYSITIQQSGGTVSSGSDNDNHKLIGTPNAIKLLNVGTNTETTPKFVDDIYVYYKGE